MDDDPFLRTPIAPMYEERKAAYLEWLLTKPTPDERGGVWADIAKLSVDPSMKINEKALQEALDYVNSRQDPSDFNMASLVRLYYLYHDTGALTAAQVQALKDCMLNSKYWLDEPNTTYLEMWTENHQMLSASAEYLAGQAFPDEVFSNDGLTGKQKMETARARFMRWSDLRSRITRCAEYGHLADKDLSTPKTVSGAGNFFATSILLLKVIFGLYFCMEAFTDSA